MSEPSAVRTHSLRERMALRSDLQLAIEAKLASLDVKDQWAEPLILAELDTRKASVWTRRRGAFMALCMVAVSGVYPPDLADDYFPCGYDPRDLTRISRLSTGLVVFLLVMGISLLASVAAAVISR